MPTFTPPVTTTVPPVLPPGSPEQSVMQYRLFRHYRSRREGVNVYIYSDGTVSEADPNGTTTFWTSEFGEPYIVYCFYGGHGPYDITDAIGALLESEGYEINDDDPGPPPDPDPEEPPPDPGDISGNELLINDFGDKLIVNSEGDNLLVD